MLAESVDSLDLARSQRQDLCQRQDKPAFLSEAWWNTDENPWETEMQYRQECSELRAKEDRQTLARSRQELESCQNKLREAEANLSKMEIEALECRTENNFLHEELTKTIRGKEQISKNFAKYVTDIHKSKVDMALFKEKKKSQLKSLSLKNDCLIRKCKRKSNKLLLLTEALRDHGLSLEEITEILKPSREMEIVPFPIGETYEYPPLAGM